MFFWLIWLTLGTRELRGNGCLASKFSNWKKRKKNCVIQLVTNITAVSATRKIFVFGGQGTRFSNNCFSKCCNKMSKQTFKNNVQSGEIAPFSKSATCLEYYRHRRFFKIHHVMIYYPLPSFSSPILRHKRRKARFLLNTISKTYTCDLMWCIMAFFRLFSLVSVGAEEGMQNNFTFLPFECGRKNENISKSVQHFRKMFECYNML